ncbi:ABC transporter ATP-binding protein [Cellulomonas sp. Marseille-Q8402]
MTNRAAWSGSPDDPQDLLVVEEVEKTYGRRRDPRRLGPATFTLRCGTVTALVGRSGSGKSTLLHCAAGLARPSRGVVRYAGREITRLSDERLARLRREEFGFVFQDYTLIDALSVRDNMALPARMSRAATPPALITDIAHSLGIGELVERPTSQLSGGQRQRVAVGRAVASGARVLFADEPTGALDPVTREEVLSVLLDPLVRESRALLVATHDVPLAAAADRVLVVDRGRIVQEIVSQDPRDVMSALRSVTGTAA